jgi:hypothetical protein
MTPEHKFVLWSNLLTAFPSIALAGMVAFWTWRRDQERIAVRKSPVRWTTLDGSETSITGVGVVVTNLSLFPVRIVGLGFRLDGKHALSLDRDTREGEWPEEIASRARMIVYANKAEWKQLEALGARARIMDWKFVAVATTETSGRFTSNRLSVQIMRPLRSLRRRCLKSRVG